MTEAEWFVSAFIIAIILAFIIIGGIMWLSGEL